MSIKQFFNTLQRIKKAPNVEMYNGLIRHMFWQARKIFGLFPFEVRLSDSIIRIQNSNQGVAALINCIGIYDFNNMLLVKLLSLQKTVFFDIGANIGSYSLIMSESNSSIVHSFEPHPSTFHELCTNIALNKRNNVILNQSALSKEKKTIRFTNYKNAALNHIVRQEVCNDFFLLDSITCQEYCANSNTIPDCVKIDVEGAEYDVLLGFGSVLKKVKLIIIELNSITDQKGVLNLLASNRFLGPYYYHNSEKCFSKFSNNEDPIFLSDCYINSNSFTKEFRIKDSK